MADSAGGEDAAEGKYGMLNVEVVVEGPTPIDTTGDGQGLCDWLLGGSELIVVSVEPDSIVVVRVVADLEDSEIRGAPGVVDTAVGDTSDISGGSRLVAGKGEINGVITGVLVINVL